jgi:hypothetical protein
MNVKAVIAASFLAFACSGLCGCGGGGSSGYGGVSTGGVTPTLALSQSDVRTIMTQLGSPVGNGSPTASQLSVNRSAKAITCTPTPGSTIVTCSGGYSYTTTCPPPGSGSISGTFTITSATFNASGANGPLGNLGISYTESITNWACFGNWVINGAPNLSGSLTETITGSTQSASFNVGGGWTATNGTQTVTCLITVPITASWSSLSGFTFSGTLSCGPPTTVYTF